ncbi:hypothetical protein [Arcobacter sp. YIC-310]|uniref:hypothetical protein n=1 Tax=Arcobacter sp. YIC-310 TaxID=3376632 RepID=UPI003C1CA817
MFNRFGYANSVEGQNQRIKEHSNEYPLFVKFIDKGLNLLDVALDAGVGFALGVTVAIFIEKSINPYFIAGAGVAGAKLKL